MLNQNTQGLSPWLSLGPWAVLFLLAMHLTMPNAGGAGLVVPFNTLTWMAFALPLGVLLYALHAQKTLVWHPSLSVLLLACVLLGLPLLYPDSQPMDGLLRVIGLWLGALILVLLCQPASGRHWPAGVLVLIMASVVLQTLAGYAQLYLLAPDNPIRYLVNGRPVGIFNQPNLMASYLVTGLALSAYWLTQHVPGQPESRRLALGLNGLALLVPVLTLPLIVALGSRTGWLAALLVGPGFLLAGLLPAGRVRWRRYTTWFAALMLGLVLAVALQNSDERAADRVSAKANMESPRYAMYRQAVDLIADRPLLGWGYGRFEPAMVEYAAARRAVEPDYPTVLPALTHPHNEVLYWVAEGGVLPLFGFVVLGGLGLWVILRQPRGRRLPGALILAPIVLHSQLELPFYVSSVHWIVLVLLLALLWRRADLNWQMRTLPQRRLPTLLRLSSLLLPGVLVVFMATTLYSNHQLNTFQRQAYRELDDLESVVNPWVWRDRIDWLRFYSALYIGVTQNQPDLVRAYVQWSEYILERKPRRAAFTYRVFAQDYLGETEAAAATRARFSRLYPEGELPKVNAVRLDTDLSGASPLLEQAEGD